jgi:hypothetical protein
MAASSARRNNIVVRECVSPVYPSVGFQVTANAVHSPELLSMIHFIVCLFTQPTCYLLHVLS